MSSARSGSPRSRRFPEEEAGFDSYRIISELNGNPMDRSHRPREGHKEQRFRDGFREDLYREGKQRTPYFQDDHQFRNTHPLGQKEFYLHRHRDVMDYDDQRLSPVDGAGGAGERRRGGCREQFQSLKNRRRSPNSPLRLDRERSLSSSRSHSDHQQRRTETGWKRDDQERGRGRFRDLSPSARLDDKRRGAGREREGRRNEQAFKRDGRREEPHQERNHPLKRQRSVMDGASPPGYRNEENIRGQRYSLDTGRAGLVGDRQGSLPRVDTRNIEPLIVEHDHGITNSRVLPGREHFEERRGHDPNLDRPRIPRLMDFSQEVFRTSDSRLDAQEDIRRYHIQDNLRPTKYLENRRSPVQQNRQNPTRHSNRDDPDSTNHQKGRSGPQPARGSMNPEQGGRTGLLRNQPRFQNLQGNHDLPHDEQKTGYRSLREDCNVNPVKRDRNWAEEQRLQQWKHGRSGSSERHPPGTDLDPKMPRQRERGWNDQKTNNMTVVTEETLTIKVDMSQLANKNSSMSYSSDRQLSLDLVNVGRQRLDFLPMLEHSGTYRETPTHTGTFAQEIITLVHQVKEQYFRDDGITLNERFSAPQKGGFNEEDAEELTLDERGFSLNTTSLLDDNVPLFSRLGPIQGLNPVALRDPGDLRHNLERRRQERLEGVKVTIQGKSMSMTAVDPVSELDYSSKGDLAQMKDEVFSSLLQEQSRRRDGNMGQRRAAPPRINSGLQRRGNHSGNQGREMKRQNNPNNPTGSRW